MTPHHWPRSSLLAAQQKNSLVHVARVDGAENNGRLRQIHWPFSGDTRVRVLHLVHFVVGLGVDVVLSAALRLRASAEFVEAAITQLMLSDFTLSA